MEIPGKSYNYKKRVQWLVDNHELWKDKGIFTVVQIMVQNGLYSPKTNVKDTAYTVENMIILAKKELGLKKNIVGLIL